MTTAEIKAPGCFGAASVFSMDSAVCQACVGFKDCGETAMQTLQSIKETIDVRDLLARHTNARAKYADRLASKQAPQPVSTSPLPIAQPKPIISPVERKTAVQKVAFDICMDHQMTIARIAEANKKAGEQAMVLAKNNRINDMRAMLPRQQNPFASSGPAFLRVACDMLINGGFTKASLKKRMMDEFTWTDGTAGSHVAITLAILGGFKLAAGVEGKIVLHPGLG